MKGLVSTGEKTKIRKQEKTERSKRKMLSEQESGEIPGSETGKTDDRKRKLQQTANKLKSKVTSKITNAYERKCQVGGTRSEGETAYSSPGKRTNLPHSNGGSNDRSC